MKFSEKQGGVFYNAEMVKDLGYAVIGEHSKAAYLRSSCALE